MLATGRGARVGLEGQALPAHEGPEARRQGFGRLTAHRGQGLDREGLAKDGRVLEQRSVSRRQGVEPGGDTQDVYLSILRGNPADRDRQTDRDEVRTLLELLRRALEGDSGVFSGLPSMAEVGQLLLARAG